MAIIKDLDTMSRKIRMMSTITDWINRTYRQNTIDGNVHLIDKDLFPEILRETREDQYKLGTMIDETVVLSRQQELVELIVQLDKLIDEVIELEDEDND